MTKIPHILCGVIPPHILKRVAAHTATEASEPARATLEHMRELATGRARTLLPTDDEAPPRDERRRVYDARHQFELPGRLVISSAGDLQLQTPDTEAIEAWRGSGATSIFFQRVFGRRSIDGQGMRLDATVHYGTGFGNAMWNGRQMVYGDGDGRVFRRFTASLDVIAHELTHGLTQYASALGYTGQTGALNEHISDAFGIMVRQFTLDQTADQSDWLIGAALFGPEAEGCAVRSLALPGSAYHHPILGSDPQPSHMDDYVHTAEDNGGVHINSGILNHAFYLAAMEIGGKTWEVPGRIWYAVLTERLTADADFDEFARATIDVAGELYGIGGEVQQIVAEAWAEVGLGPDTPIHQPQQQRKENLAMNTIDFNTRKRIDAAVRDAMASLANENMLLAETPNVLLQRALKVYTGIKPLLTFLTGFPILPQTWRTGVTMLTQVLDALAAVGPQVTVEFKAGRDLEPAA